MPLVYHGRYPRYTSGDKYAPHRRMASGRNPGVPRSGMRRPLQRESPESTA